MTSEARIQHWRAQIEQHLSTTALAPQPGIPQTLQAAMHYAVTGGGKRIRPLLVYASGYLLNAEEDNLLIAALAVELIHTYSLIHDDLPAMDNDDLRRGRATTHIAFDEASAILAGDALHSRAFELLTTHISAPTLALACIQTLSTAAGAGGMCGGQILDMHATGKHQSVNALEQMHQLKTGALIRAAVRLGALCGQADTATLEQLDRFANALGLAFQIRDDILDIESSTAELGKTTGKDSAFHKSTFPSVLGLLPAKTRLQQLAQILQNELVSFGPRAEPLNYLAQLAILRNH